MSDSIKDKLTETGHRVAEGLEKAADWTKEKAHEAGHKLSELGDKASHSAASLGESTGSTGSVADIKEHSEVYASCGTFVGKVDHVEGSEIKLTKSDSPDGVHHLIPTSWVAKVHDHVHLSKTAAEVHAGWTSA